MGRKKAEPETEAAKGSEVDRHISKGKLKTLLIAKRNGAKDIQSINATLAQKIGGAKENDHLHTKAFAEIVKRDKMTPEELADYVDVVELYSDMTGLTERAKSAPRLRLEPQNEEGGEDGEEDGEEEKEPARQAEPFPEPPGTAKH